MAVTITAAELATDRSAGGVRGCGALVAGELWS